MRKKEKIKNVLSGKELLIVDSLHRKIPEGTVTMRLTYCTILYMLGLVIPVLVIWGETEVIMIFWILLTCVFVLALMFIAVYQRGKGNPLILTDRGAVIPAIAGDSWGEIESYTWENYYGVNKLPGASVLSAAEGTCLRINTKKILSSRWINGRGGNVMAIYLIFFSENQKCKAEEIFSTYGIRNRIDLD